MFRLIAFAITSASLALWGCAAAAGQDSSPVVEKVAEVLAGQYVDATLGQQLSSELKRLDARGELDRRADETSEQFADRLTAVLRSIVPDGHLTLTYEPDREFVPGLASEQPVMRRIVPDGSGTVQRQDAGATRPAAPGARMVVRTGRIDGRSAEEVARTNFGFDEAKRLPGNIGYLRLNRFVPLDLSRATAASAMGFVAHTEGLIIDLRGNIGGSPDLVTFLMSYLYPAGAPPVLLLETARRDGETEKLWTLGDVPGRRLGDVPVWILVDRVTGSAGEMFAYIAQHQGRAQVIGGVTAGLGNGGNKVSVGQGFALFVPERKILTGPGWQGTGVTPDHEVPEGDALATAHQLAIEHLIGKTGNPDLKAQRQKLLDELKAGSPALTTARVDSAGPLP